MNQEPDYVHFYRDIQKTLEKILNSDLQCFTEVKRFTFLFPFESKFTMVL